MGYAEQLTIESQGPSASATTVLLMHSLPWHGHQLAPTGFSFVGNKGHT